MKLIITGATGYLGKALVRYCLLDRKDITTIVAVARKPVTVGDYLDEAEVKEVAASKLRSAVAPDYASPQWPEAARKEFEGAGGCIWTVGVTPGNMFRYTEQQLRRICVESTVRGLENMRDAGVGDPSSKKFRFIYLSGPGMERDQTRKSTAPWLGIAGKFSLVRGDAENHTLHFPNFPSYEAVVARPGFLLDPPGLASSWLPSPRENARKTMGFLFDKLFGTRSFTWPEISRALVNAAILGHGKFESGEGGENRRGDGTLYGEELKDLASL